MRRKKTKDRERERTREGVVVGRLGLWGDN